MPDAVQVLDRALDIIEYLSAERQPRGPTDIAAATDLNKTTVYRLLSSLQQRGYIEKNETNGTYRIGVKLVEVASNHINNLELQTEARPYLYEMQSELGLIVHLGILDKHEVVYVEKMDINPNLRRYAQIGARVPAQCSSLGKCLLSGLSSDELAHAMRDCRFPKYTDRTITSLHELKRYLQKVRQQGWAIDDEEYTSGQRCIGAPIYDYRGDIIAAISASGPTSLLTDERIPDTVRSVTKTATEISRRLCYRIE
ncbi:IclR family transcriptional regulator [Synergistaceae bacterium OttesenSCG-928-I11]|nr:IclR family transcriptional regulator [Synergistaceae bacterium OttesenSCG-928-I11]